MDTPLQSTPPQRLPPSAFDRGSVAVGGALLGLTVLLLLRRYVGIHHDAALYLGQGLLQRWPAIFGQDLVFAHGDGQERYTLLPWLLGHSLRWVEPAPLFLWTTLLSSVAFAAAGWYCLRALLPSGPRYWAWLGTLALPSTYGVVEMFGYGEQFLTPRPIAEASCLAAIALLAARRWALALAVLAMAAAFHPLQTLAAGLVMWAWAVLLDRRWLHLAWLAIPIFALAGLDFGPFGGLLRQIDPQWASNLRAFTRQIYVTEWTRPDWMTFVLDALVLWYACRSSPGAFGRWCGAALLGLGIGVLASLLLVDVWELVLPAGLQTWRVHWLAHWLAMAAIAALLHRDVRARDSSRALLLLLTCLLAWMSGQWFWLALACLYAAWPRVFTLRRGRLVPYVGALAALGIAILFASHIEGELARFGLAHYRLELYAVDRRILAFPALALGIPLLGTLVWSRAGTALRGMLGAVLCLVLLVAAGRWDVRSPLILAFEEATFRTDIFGIELPEEAEVFWSGHSLIGPWLVLRRASYFTPHQISGQVFNRALSEDGRMRLARVRPLIEEGMGCEEWSIPSDLRASCHISGAAMRRACQQDGFPSPDFLVLSLPQPQPAVGEWSIIDPATGEPAVTYRLYRCADIIGKPLAWSQAESSDIAR